MARGKHQAVAIAQVIAAPVAVELIAFVNQLLEQSEHQVGVHIDHFLRPFGVGNHQLQQLVWVNHPGDDLVSDPCCAAEEQPLPMRPLSSRLKTGPIDSIRRGGQAAFVRIPILPRLDGVID